MKGLFPLLATMIVMVATPQAAIMNNQSKDDISLERAKHLWEMAVAAKGGRERLDAVKSIAITQDFGGRGRSTELCVFPDKYWAWEDRRPSKLGLAAEMRNFERNIGYFVVGYLPNDPKKSELKPEDRASFRNPQLIYLLETKWFKPEVLRAYKDNLGLHSVDVVETRVGKFRIAVFLDTKTHLPVRVGYFSNYVDKIFTWYGLSDYHEVNGILVPHSISYDGSRNIPVQVEINVDYDPAVFERPPRIDDGPYQWRPKSSKPANSSARRV
ncbi:MAG: hypothetical protein AABO57_20500 [Acidobacteriota bacterium]